VKDTSPNDSPPEDWRICVEFADKADAADFSIGWAVPCPGSPQA
jgi:hypothetical protein